MRASRYGVLTAMIFAVAMMSIDQTIVAIAAPTIQRDLALTSTGLQWVINGYILALAALFALGGKLSDVVGHRRMVLVGTVGFAIASILCGATPKGSAAQAWLVTARLLQGGFGALLFPAALAIVFNGFAARERGKALALFFGISGALTSIGPIAGSFLLPWTWRAIFLINVPVALVALWLTWRARPPDTRRPTPIDVRGAVLVSAGMALAVVGLQQSANWGWTSAATLACLASGVAPSRGLRALRAAAAEPADRGRDLRPSRVRGRQRRDGPRLRVLLAPVLLRLGVRAGRARLQRRQDRPVHPGHLHRLRGRDSARRPHARPAGRATGRDRRLRARRGRLLFLGRPPPSTPRAPSGRGSFSPARASVSS